MGILGGYCSLSILGFVASGMSSNTNKKYNITNATHKGTNVNILARMQKGTRADTYSFAAN